jgi:uncharacterized protein YggE
MKEKFGLIAIACLVICAALFNSAAAVTDGNDDKVIHVSGTGMVKTDPDRVEISLAVETENPDVKIAQQENAIRMNQVIEALKAAGLTSEDMKTTGYNIYPVTDYDGNSLWGKEAKYYRVTNTLLITLTDISKAGEVIDIAVKSGANRVNSVSFTLSDEKYETVRSEALIDAVEKAKADADVVSAALGVRIVSVKEVTVGQGYSPYLYSGVYSDAKGYAEAAPTPIEADTIDVTATVSVTYLIA